jgi:hypothetical protein
MLSDNLEEVGVGGKIILKWMFKKIGCGMYYIDLAQDW